MKLDDLAQASGVSARTVRYYVQRGLLPAPVFRGRDTAYSDDHLLRLKAIRRLQDRFLPLDAIQAELERRSAEELRRLAEGQDVPPSPPVELIVTQRPAPTGEQWTRVTLAPGLELNLSESADAMTRALFHELRTLCEKKGIT